MIFVLLTYGGWNEMAYVAAEVKEPRKNILRALLIGTLAVTAIYVIVNLAFVHAVGLEGTRHATVAADVLELGIGPLAGQAISLLICISALGAINGQIFTGSRIYYAMGNDHRLYAWLGRWNARRGTPVPSLLIQGAITLALVVWFGLTAARLRGHGDFHHARLLVLPDVGGRVGVRAAVARSRRPNGPTACRAIRCTPILFCLSSAFMVYSSVDYAVQNQSWEAIWSIAILLLGVAMSFYRTHHAPRDAVPSRGA